MTDTSKLKAGDRHPRAYVGPPQQYDFMGATQFRLLTSLGLRENHTVLDFGCGSLRAGRLLLPYLLPGHYFGIEPNKWLIDSAIETELGTDYVARRKPKFDYNDRFTFDVFDRSFDFIILQSILSHTGADLTQTALRNAKSAMHERSVLLVTIIHEGQSGDMPRGVDREGWIYPGCVSYAPDWFAEITKAESYFSQELPWFHPRQTWYLLSLSESNLIPEQHLRYLKGAVLRDSRFKQFDNV